MEHPIKRLLLLLLLLEIMLEVVYDVLHHRIRKPPFSSAHASVNEKLAFSKISKNLQKSRESVFGKMFFYRILVNSRSNRRKKKTFSNKNGYVWTGPACY